MPSIRQVNNFIKIAAMLARNDGKKIIPTNIPAIDPIIPFLVAPKILAPHIGSILSSTDAMMVATPRITSRRLLNGCSFPVYCIKSIAV